MTAGRRMSATTAPAASPSAARPPRSTRQLAGTYSYTPNPDFNGTDTLHLHGERRDGAGSNTATVSLITVNPVNDAPVAQDGSASGNEDTPISGTLVATDVDSPSLIYALGTQAAHGVVAVNSDGTYTYAPNPDFNGADSFTFTASDGTAASNAATVSLTINPVDDAPVAQDGSASGNEDTPISGTLVATDVDSPSLTYNLGTQAAHGVVAVNSDGSYTYTPNPDFNGADSFTFTASDGTAGSNTATVSLTINPVNDAPVNTVPGAQTVNEDTVLAIDGLSVADVDSATLTTTLTVANGLLTVVPETGVTITGNLANTVTISGSAADVNAALAGVNYAGNPGFVGADTLTIATSDGALTDTDTVAITVNPVNDAPHLDLDADNSSGALGSNLVTTFTENSPAVALADADIVLTDDAPDLTSARFLLINAQTGDSLVVNGVLPDGIIATIAANELTLTGTVPVADYQTALRQIAFSNSSDAPDTSDRLILVTVDDGVATSNAFALVHLTAVNDAPVAQDGNASGNEDTPINGTLVATDVDSPGLIYALGAQPTHGTVAVNPDGSYTYTPNPDFNGADSFTFTASDGTAGSNTATVDLTINPVNDAPVAQDGSNSGNEDTPINGTLVATDVDSPSLIYALGTQAAHGVAAVNPDGTYSYTPNPDFNGPDSFTFTASDGAASSNMATVSLSINPVNDAPVAQDGSNSGNEDTPISGTLVATDVDSPSLIYALGTQAAHGAVGVNPDGTYSYTPNADFNGADSFTFTASDGSATSNAATISLTVNPVNDAPMLDLDADDSTSSGSGYATTFVEDGAAVTIADTDIAITASTLRSATITLTNPLPGDLLSVSGTLPGGIAAVYDPATGVMTLTGTAPALQPTRPRRTRSSTPIAATIRRPTIASSRSS